MKLSIKSVSILKNDLGKNSQNEIPKKGESRGFETREQIPTISKWFQIIRWGIHAAGFRSKKRDESKILLMAFGYL